MDDFRAQLIAGFLTLAHANWENQFGHKGHLDEPHWDRDVVPVLDDALTDALAEPQRQHDVYRGILE